ncbi:hypothetical protein DH2020_041405 [Rehmannia glutinosa]|uniref:U3 small nucleolar RNA-associated protein 11 n=1 Tax=Rehmannia glutinosa TaxID=99300 RepID=A0ABR0US96_REHGL
MSSLRNAIPRKAHKERAQPHSRRRFGLLEKHKDYVGVHEPSTKRSRHCSKQIHYGRAHVDEDARHWIYFAETSNRKKKIEKLSGMLHSLDNHSSSKHVYYADDSDLDQMYIVVLLLSTFYLSSLSQHWDEAREIQAKVSEDRKNPTFEDLPKDIKRKTAASYRELEARKNRVQELEKIYMDMAMQKELQKKGRKRKLRQDEIVTLDSRPVYKWRQERKR